MEIIEQVLVFIVVIACIGLPIPTVVAFIKALIKGKKSSKEEGDNK